MVRRLSEKRHLLKAYEFDHQDVTHTHTINIIQLLLNKYLFKLNTPSKQSKCHQHIQMQYMLKYKI